MRAVHREPGYEPEAFDPVDELLLLLLLLPEEEEEDDGEDEDAAGAGSLAGVLLPPSPLSLAGVAFSPVDLMPSLGEASEPASEGVVRLSVR